MKLATSIFASALVLAAALVFVSLQPAESQSRGAGYMIAGDGGQFIWRVNTSTGQVSYCVRKDNSLDERFIANRPPYCSASTPAP